MLSVILACFLVVGGIGIFSSQFFHTDVSPFTQCAYADMPTPDDANFIVVGSKDGHTISVDNDSGLISIACIKDKTPQWWLDNYLDSAMSHGYNEMQIIEYKGYIDSAIVWMQAKGII